MVRVWKSSFRGGGPVTVVVRQTGLGPPFCPRREKLTVKPQDLHFAKTHEWVSVAGPAGQRVATVGISDFAVHQLTDLVYIELPKVGREVRVGEPFGEIESVKAVSDLYSPVTGEIVEVNEALKDSLEVFSQDPFGAGWVMKVRLTDESSLAGLLDFHAYQKQCADEG